MNDIRKLAFIGGGNMAAALIGGLVRRGLACKAIVVADPNAEQCARLAREFGVSVAADNRAAAQHADVVVLAVKPQRMREIATDIAAVIQASHPLVVSVAAGIPHAALVRWLGPGVAIVRSMPNRPALNGFGATGLYAPSGVDASQRGRAESLMAAVSATVWVEQESQMDTVTALSGSGPAYFFLFMEALETAAQARGLPADIARKLTLETALGAAQMARLSTVPVSVLRDEVTSKGGTTAAALAVFDAAGLRTIVADALGAAQRRSAELAAEFGEA